MCRKNKAQVSLEFLILFVVFLAFLLAWMPIINTVRAQAENGIDYALARMAASDIAYAIDDVCFSGAGNVRLVEIKLRKPARIVGENGVVKVVANGKTLAQKNERCWQNFDLVVGGGGLIFVKNDGARIDVALAGR